MSLIFMTLDRKGRATLPEEVRRSLHLKAGDFVLLEQTDRGTYELVPAELVPKDQLWFHHPEMQKRLTKAEESLVGDRGASTTGTAEAQTLLDSLKGSAAANAP